MDYSEKAGVFSEKGEIDKQGRNTGLWVYKKKNDTVGFGNFFEGLLYGNWTYSYKKNIFNVKWIIEEDPIRSIKFSIPKYKNKKEINNVAIYLLDSLDITLMYSQFSEEEFNNSNNYLKRIVEVNQNEKKPKKIKYYQFKQGTENFLIFIVFPQLENNNNEEIVYNFSNIGSQGGFALNLRANIKEKSKAEQIFSEMIKHFYLNDKQLINPYKEVTENKIVLPFYAYLNTIFNNTD